MRQPQYTAQAFQINIFCTYLMVIGHHDLPRFRQHLIRLLAAHFHYRVAGRFCTLIRHVEDKPLVLTFNSRMRFLHKRLQVRGVPVVTPGQGSSIAHALLYYGPLSFFTHDEIVQVQLVSILDSRIIHFGAELTATHQVFGIQTGLFTNAHQLIRGLAGVFTLATRNVQAQFRRAGIDGSFESTHYGSSNPRGMPVHAHNGSQALEPERIAEPAQHLARAFLQDESFHDGLA